MPTSDGGSALVGYSSSNDGDVSGGHNVSGNAVDMWVVKLNVQGAIQWQRCLGGSSSEFGSSIQTTADGGYVVASSTTSNDGDVSGHHNVGSNDVWVVKLDPQGTIQWQRCLGGSASESVSSVQTTADGGYVVVGSTRSIDGDVSGCHGLDDVWVVKLNAQGAIQWQRCLGGSESEIGLSIQTTADGGYVVAGYTSSKDGDVSGHHGGAGYDVDMWVVKLNAQGAIQWQRCFGGSSFDFGSSIQTTADGGYVVAGQTSSNNGDVSGHHGGFGDDMWVVKLSAQGTIQWQRCFGGSSQDTGSSIQTTADGGYVVAGHTSSNNGDVSGHHGTAGYDMWVVKLNPQGTIQWQRCLGGSSVEFGSSVQITTDGGYVVVGHTSSNDGDVSGHHNVSSNDIWVVKLGSTSNLCQSVQSGDWTSATTWSCGREPTNADIVTINPGHVVTLSTNSAQALRVVYTGGTVKFSAPSAKIFVKGGG